MSSDADAAWEAIVERLLGEDERIELKRAFASPGLRFDDKIFAMVVKGELVVKLDEQRCEALVAEGRVRAFAMKERVMREWVVSAPERSGEWEGLADEALAYARMASATRRP